MHCAVANRNASSTNRHRGKEETSSKTKKSTPSKRGGAQQPWEPEYAAKETYVLPAKGTRGFAGSFKGKYRRKLLGGGKKRGEGI